MFSKKTLVRLGALAMLCAVAGLLLAQYPHHRDRQEEQQEEPGNLRLPNGKMQRDEILKAEHEKDVKDAAELVKLAGDLQTEVEKNSSNVLSLNAIKKTEEIEKVARRIRARMKRY